MLLGRDLVDGVGPFGVAGDDAALGHERVERALHAVVGVELEVAGGRQLAAVARRRAGWQAAQDLGHA